MQRALTSLFARTATATDAMNGEGPADAPPVAVGVAVGAAPKPAKHSLPAEGARWMVTERAASKCNANQRDAGRCQLSSSRNLPRSPSDPLTSPGRSIRRHQSTRRTLASTPSSSLIRSHASSHVKQRLGVLLFLFGGGRRAETEGTCSSSVHSSVAQGRRARLRARPRASTSRGLGGCNLWHIQSIP